jgi:glyoxylase-like metal-dependent hydrolase (beta-lactamase superfamily II)
MDGLQAIFTPGHAPGHLAFWQPEKKVLFCGDTIFRIPFNMRLPFAMLTVDMAEDIRSIGRLTTLNPDIICFGHSQPLMENTADLLRQFAQKWAPSAPWPQYVP